jgi:hypothetical protein
MEDSNKFNAGTYVVLLASSDGKNLWLDDLPVGYCFLLRENSSSNVFKVAKDIKGNCHNGWSCDYSFASKLKLRLATVNEINEYNRLDRPFDTVEFNKFINNSMYPVF